jgi:endo-1,4-beta-xylanase
MQSQFTMFWDNANVTGITLWGYVVGATWKTNTGLINSAGTKRPAIPGLWIFSDAEGERGSVVPRFS